MNFYSFQLKRYQRSYRQAKCLLVFSCFFMAFAILSLTVRYYSATSFYILLFAGGWITWTFAEYILHRFWMHDKTSHSLLANTHHHHHTHPTELVITNLHRVLMILFLLLVGILAFWVQGYFAFVAGLFFGIVGYFMMHKLLHQRLAQHFFKKLVRYHIYHHCKYSNNCFGISVTWWDDLFGTVPTHPAISQRIIDFYFNHG